MQSPVDIHVSEGIVQITLNRPERRNALSFEMAQVVSQTLDELDARSDLQVAIITGAGGCFSSGMDIKDFAESGRRPSLPGRGVLGLGEQSKDWRSAVGGKSPSRVIWSSPARVPALRSPRSSVAWSRVGVGSSAWRNASPTPWPWRSPSRAVPSRRLDARSSA